MIVHAKEGESAACGTPLKRGHRLRTAEEPEAGGVTGEKCREILRAVGYPAYQEQETPRPPAAGKKTPQDYTHLRSLRSDRLTFCGRWIYDDALTVKDAQHADCEECHVAVNAGWGRHPVGRMLRELASDYRAKPRCTPPTTEALLAVADEMARTFRLVCAQNKPGCDGVWCRAKPAGEFTDALARYREMRGVK